MADKRATPDAPHDTRDDANKGPRRGKRAAPTIDLTAQEVKSAEPPPPQDAPPQPKPAREERKPEFQRGEQPMGKPPGRDGRAWPSLPGAMFAGGVAGAGITVLILVALWLAGVMPTRPAVVTSSATRDRVSALETQIRDLQSHPAASGGKSIDALTERLGKLEQSLAKIPAGEPAVAERLSAADNAMKSLGVALAALNKRSDDVAANAQAARERADAATQAVNDVRVSIEAVKNTAAGMAPAELDALQKRLAALEQSAKSARDEIARNSATDKAARLALSAAALRDAAASGTPFAGSLKETKALGADETSLAPLTPFAERGVPDDKTMAERLSALLPAMLKVSGAQAPSGGFLERLEANAGRLVRIRPVDAPPGDDVSAVLARIEIAAAKADIAGALADLDRLPAATRAPATDWIAQAKARAGALAAARKLAADTARALTPRTDAQ